MNWSTMSAVSLPSLMVFALLLQSSSSSSELTFELPDKEKLCFHEIIDKDIKCTLEYQVVTGGNYDVDVELAFQSGQPLYKEVKKQYDSYTWTTAARGEYRICFSNEFSTFTHKLVYFDFKVGEEDPIKSVLGVRVTALTQMESSAGTMHENLKTIIDYQTHHRMRESQGQAFAEDLNDRVQFWSLGQSVVILVVSIGQIMVLRSFFTDKHSHASPSFVST